MAYYYLSSFFLLTIVMSIVWTICQGYHGQILAVTDVHIDPYAREGMSKYIFCHRPGSESSIGIFGARTCDATNDLVTNFVWQSLNQTWASQIDAVYFLGDIVRHDMDPSIPRTRSEMNETISNFLDNLQTAAPNVPIVLTIGNNDVLVHNTLGENNFQFHTAYRRFIPKDQHSLFQRFGYYSQDIVPNKIRVLSINTLYFYLLNKEVNGCQNKGDLGTLHLDWLQKELEMVNDQNEPNAETNILVHIIGHLPPFETLWHQKCYARYVGLIQIYENVIALQAFSHTHLDHFTVLYDRNRSHKHRNNKKLNRRNDNNLENKSLKDLTFCKSFDRRHYIKVEDGSSIAYSSNSRTENDLNHKRYMQSSWNAKQAIFRKRNSEPLHHITLEDKQAEHAFAVIFNVPSLAPNSNPSYRIFKFDTKNSTLGQIVNYNQLYSALDEANEKKVLHYSQLYDAKKFYNMKDFKAQNWAHLQFQIHHNDTLRKLYIYNLHVGEPDRSWKL